MLGLAPVLLLARCIGLLPRPRRHDEVFHLHRVFVASCLSCPEQKYLAASVALQGKKGGMAPLTERLLGFMFTQAFTSDEDEELEDQEANKGKGKGKGDTTHSHSSRCAWLSLSLSLPFVLRPWCGESEIYMRLCA